MGRLYIDMDGVLADFDRGLREFYKLNGPDDPHPLDDRDRAKAFWSIDCVGFSIFEELPEVERFMVGVLPDLPTGNTVILTSTGGGVNHMEIAKQKACWLSARDIVCDLPVIFCLNTANKASFAQLGDVLIDDRQKVIDAWHSAGGRGVLWDGSVSNCIARLIDLEVL